MSEKWASEVEDRTIYIIQYEEEKKMKKIKPQGTC